MRIVLDTNVVLYLLADRLADPLPPAAFFVSVITEMELLSYPLLNPGEEAAIHDFLCDVTVCDWSPDVKVAAITLRRQYRLKLPDAVVAATALSLRAELLTNDTKLQGIANLSATAVTLRP